MTRGTLPPCAKRVGRHYACAAPARGRAPFEARSLALDHIVYPGHHRFAWIHADFGQSRDESLPKRLECRLRLPYVEDLNLAVCLEGDVVGASFGGARARFFKPAE